MELKTTTVTIHSQAMAGYLMMRKFILIDQRVDLKNNKLNVFIFKESNEIKQAMKQYSEDRYKLDKILFK